MKKIPNHKVHKIIGLFFGIFIYLLFAYWIPILRVELYLFFLGILIAYVFSYLPDIDTAASKARKHFLVFSFLAILILAMQLVRYRLDSEIALKYGILMILLIGLNLVVILCSKHHGIWHKLYTPFILASPFLYWKLWGLYIIAVSSYLSHIFADRILGGRK